MAGAVTYFQAAVPAAVVLPHSTDPNPAKADSIDVQAQGGDVRIRIDGVAPDANTGDIIPQNQILPIELNDYVYLTNIQVIAKDAGAKVGVNYYYKT